MLVRDVLRYNQHLPQHRLQHQTLILAMKLWWGNKMGLFEKAVSNRAGLDI